MKKPTKPAISFRLGQSHRAKLEEIAEFRDEPQVEVLRTMINVAYKAVQKRKAEKEEAKRTAA